MSRIEQRGHPEQEPLAQRNEFDKLIQSHIDEIKSRELTFRKRFIVSLITALGGVMSNVDIPLETIDAEQEKELLPGPIQETQEEITERLWGRFFLRK